MNQIRKVAKNILGKGFSKFNYPIIVNSYGRSGSTVLTKSIIESAIDVEIAELRDIAFRSVYQEEWNLNKVDLKDGIVYKTHDYPPHKNFNKKIKMVYTFANPVDVILSLLRLYNTKGENWMREHYDHLKVQYCNFKRIVCNDDLQLEQHLESWLQEKRFPVAFIKYESMWDHQDEISDFLGFPITLPPYRERKSNQEKDEELIDIINNNYESLIKKIGTLEGFFTNCV